MHKTNLSKVEVETIIIDEVTLDGAQVYENIFKLTQKEEARCHALATWNGVTLTGTAANQLKVLLGYFYMFSL
jgi:hypothetical protein